MKWPAASDPPAVYEISKPRLSSADGALVASRAASKRTVPAIAAVGAIRSGFAARVTVLGGEGLACVLRRRRALAASRGAAHVAHDIEIVEAAHAVHGRAVVPHHEVVLCPAMDIDEAGLRRMLDQIADESHRLGPGPADDAADMGSEEQRLASRARMGAHQALAHRLH